MNVSVTVIKLIATCIFIRVLRFYLGYNSWLLFGNKIFEPNIGDTK